MSVIDWQVIAVAIREQRLQDIPGETWSQIADKIDTKKRGKGRPPNSELGLEAKLVRDLFLKMKTLDGEMTWSERCLCIEQRYNELRGKGMKSGQV